MQAQFNPGLSPEELAKPWSLAATIRGFYDDNYLTLPNVQPDGVRKRSSYGVEFSPMISWNYAPEQTTIGVNYVYDVRYFDDRNNPETFSHILNASDQSHLFNANISHTFSERFSMQAADTFIYSSEPTVQEQTGGGLLSAYTLGDYIHNTGTIGGTTMLTKQLDLKTSYQNDVYAYMQLGPGSRSALLDRMEQLVSGDLDWKATEALTGILGYQYEHVGFTSPYPIILGPPNVYSQERDNDSHFAYIGADEQFTPQLVGRIRAGAQYVIFNRAPTYASEVSPYVDASLTWQYMKGSTLQAGVKHEHNATDVVGINPAANGNPVLDSEATAGYVDLTQKIAGALTGSLLGQFQHSVFNGGADDGEHDNFMILGANLGYRFSPYWSAETGYNWNKLVSSVPFAGTQRDYTRNEVYIGLKGEF